MTNIVHTLASQRTDLALDRLEAQGVLFLSDYDVGTLEIIKTGSSYVLDEIDPCDYSLARRCQDLTIVQVREEVLSYFTTLVKVELL